jgi:hypothetical protein
MFALCAATWSDDITKSDVTIPEFDIAMIESSSLTTFGLHCRSGESPGPSQRVPR